MAIIIGGHYDWGIPARSPKFERRYIYVKVILFIKVNCLSVLIWWEGMGVGHGGRVCCG